MKMYKYPTLETMIREYLQENGYDGLWDKHECGCILDDFMPCSEPHLGCRAGYKVGELGIGKKGEVENDNRTD